MWEWWNGPRHVAVNKTATIPALKQFPIWLLNTHSCMGVWTSILPQSVFLSPSSGGESKLAFGQHSRGLELPGSGVWLYLRPGCRGRESRGFSERGQGLIGPPNVPLIKEQSFLFYVICKYVILWFVLLPLRHQISKMTLIKKKPFYIMMITSYPAAGSQDNYCFNLKGISAWAISSVSEYCRWLLELGLWRALEAADLFFRWKKSRPKEGKWCGQVQGSLAEKLGMELRLLLSWLIHSFIRPSLLPSFFSFFFFISIYLCAFLLL